MKIVADSVAVMGAHAPMLLPTSLEASTGQVALVAGDPGHAHVALALVLGGQLTPSAGTVLMGGSPDPATRRRRTALVDVEGVTSPEGGIPVRAVIGEELALSGQRARERDVTAFLDADDALELAGERWENVSPATRTQWLARLASERGEVDVLILGFPDRYGGDPHDWWDLAQDLAGTGRAVIVQCSHGSARVLGQHRYFELGADS